MTAPSALGDLARAAGPGAAVVAVAAVWGGATSPLQGVVLGPFADVVNSVSGWLIVVVALAAALVVVLPRAVPALGARATVVIVTLATSCALAALPTTYAAVSTLRGFPDTEVVWAVVGALAGLVVGPAVAAWRSPSPTRAAGGAGVVAGVLLGDALSGFATLPGQWGAWCVALAAALGVAVLVGRTRAAGPRAIGVLGATTVGVAALAVMGLQLLAAVWAVL